MASFGVAEPLDAVEDISSAMTSSICLPYDGASEHRRATGLEHGPSALEQYLKPHRVGIA
jgi:hypothetical protein